MICYRRAVLLLLLGLVVVGAAVPVGRATAEAGPVLRLLGTTEAGGTVELVVSVEARRVVALSVENVACGPRTASAVAVGEVAITGDAFSFAAPRESLRAGGRFVEATRVEGTLSLRGQSWETFPVPGVPVTSPSLPACETGEVAWSAEAVVSGNPEVIAPREAGVIRAIEGEVDLLNCFLTGRADRVQDEAAGVVRTGALGLERTFRDEGGSRLSFGNADGVLGVIDVTGDYTPASRERNVNGFAELGPRSFSQATAEVIRQHACGWAYLQGYVEAASAE